MDTNKFYLRHIGVSDKDLPEMLQTINVHSLEQLIEETIPADIRLKKDFELPEPLSEYEYAQHISELAQKNKIFKTYIGQGYNEAITPAVILRNIFENPGWYTAYTPYQAEVAQGRLEALLNYQTMLLSLTGMELANASLLDEGTAVAEAMSMFFELRSREQKKQNINKFFVSKWAFSQTIAVVKTRAKVLGIDVVVDDEESFNFSSEYFGAFVQNPNKNGEVKCLADFTSKAHKAEIKVVIAADLLSLVLLKAPAAWGVDAVVGTTQRFGIPLGFGGPHAAYFATKDEYKRSIPGRIIGVTKDANGNNALRMALQTREQHIKRDKATSNICTAQVLLAVMAGMYAVYHGPDGLRNIAERIHFSAVSLTEHLSQLGYNVLSKNYFDTIIVKADSSVIRPLAENSQINFNYIDNQTIGISLNEATTLNDLNAIIKIFAIAKNLSHTEITKLTPRFALDNNHLRTDAILIEKIFNSYHNETDMMRYIKKLERKDLSLNHSMISLGSCTMKLNAATEMLPLSSATWGNIHPFAPKNQAEGYLEMLTNLENYLSKITGFAGTSLQPNSGASGEYAGLITIRAYQKSKGEAHRDVCLIPASAHGTNPASAVMAGMKIVVTKTDEQGNIDVADLREKAELHKENLSALMVTYPSTHGVFESSIREICQIIHTNGGQVYMDGANMNAQVGFTNPGTIGADVCHLNLHKTFAIPHGGGGPGVGPICVAAHLVPFLPANIVTDDISDRDVLSSAPYGSALVCLISYAYIRMLGTEGLKKATQYAILNANYLKEKLKDFYPILYTGERGRAAHEMILDCREFKQKHVEVIDIAKRLMDYGYHAPTVSFPVAGTLMVEPTESESKAELDKFIAAMQNIRKEIDTITDDNNPVKNAPHTLAMLTANTWEFPYSREQAAYPLEYLHENKFWPSVRRVDDAYGDRNLICSCAPIENYQ